jgi:HD-GYP domain-containing protein (c-di-GMP phosphodiesterase class II)
LVSLMRLKRHDEYRAMHAVAVCALMVSLARELALDDEARVNAGLAGLLLDVGKATLPDALLDKPGALTEDEWTQVKTHPERGHALLKQTGGVTREALEVCLHHHERLDGSGYPQGLAGDALSELARMAAICDVYDAITSNRPYKHSWDPAEAIAHMASVKGAFDPALYSAFVRCLGIYPTGALVRLQSERLAVALEQNPGAMCRAVISGPVREQA